MLDYVCVCLPQSAPISMAVLIYADLIFGTEHGEPIVVSMVRAETAAE